MKKEERQSVDEILEDRIEKVQRRREWRRFLVECVVIVAAVFLFFHGLTAAEWLITLLIAAFALLLPFAACFLWNLRRK